MSRFGDSREFMNDTYEALLVRSKEVGAAKAIREYLEILDLFMDYEVEVAVKDHG